MDGRLSSHGRSRPPPTGVVTELGLDVRTGLVMRVADDGRELTREVSDRTEPRADRLTVSVGWVRRAIPRSDTERVPFTPLNCEDNSSYFNTSCYQLRKPQLVPPSVRATLGRRRH